MADRERGFNTGEYVPGQDKVAETPAERAVEAAADLSGILRVFFANPEWLETGGHVPMMEDYLKATRRLEDIMYAIASRTNNRPVAELLNRENQYEGPAKMYHTPGGD
jgi:hypothetical protein